MEELENVTRQETDGTGTDTDYIKAIKEIKDNSVPKEQYEKVRDENRKLLASLVNGESLPQDIKPVDINELRDSLFNKENTNLEYATKALQLRDELLARGENDPFLPYGKKIVPTDEDIIAANRVAQVLRDCVEYANGDSQLFTSELQRVMVDTAPLKKNIRR